MEIKKIVTGALEENCYVLSKDGTCLIVDPGSDSKAIKELVGEDKIIGVLVTHAHFDHIGALRDFLNSNRRLKIFKKSNLKDLKEVEVGTFKFIPIMMPVYLAIQVPSGKLTAGLRQLPIPTKMMLTVIVILRFMPTILSEFSDVKDAMRTRGFLRSPSHVLFHPLATMEYVAVPMIFRSLKIADELASSCMVRGIESPYKKQGYYVNKMRSSDILLMTFFLAATVGFLVL